MIPEFEFSPEFILYLKYASIPIVSGAIGWFTNKVAVIMTFEPLNFWGVKVGPVPLGWQGIIPANAPKMAEISVDLMTEKLINIEEIFGRLKPEDVAREMAPQMMKTTRNVINKAMMTYSPVIWSNTPTRFKNAIYERAAADMPDAIKGMLNDIQGNLKDLLDIKKMCVDALMKNPGLINEIFKRCGKEEFKFIEVSGWWFGLIFGIFQMVVWIVYPANWTLPVCGIIVGYVTNWLALKLIFEPKRVWKVGPWKILGLFIKRQMEVSEEYSRIVTAEILNSVNFWDHMLNDKSGDKMMSLLEKHVGFGVDKAASNMARPVVEMVVGAEKYEEVRRTVVHALVRELPKSMMDMAEFTDNVFDIETTMRSRLQSLSPDEFEGVLRPAFEEEELKLILVGAFLGGLAGFGQLMLIFGGGS
jgi:uncharacterized membrane protein YheB (UPF0754 family)